MKQVNRRRRLSVRFSLAEGMLAYAYAGSIRADVCWQHTC
jgi:hypothetical protein